MAGGAIVAFFRNATASVLARAAANSTKEAVYAALSTVGALTGVGLSTVGIYELAMMWVPAFAYPHVFASMVALGLLTMYAFSIGTSGILYSNELRMCMLISAVSGILLSEFWLVLSVPLDPAKLDVEFEDAWRGIFDSNRGQLQWIEHRYGCRGFRNATDMPSNGRYNGGNGGCLPFMRSVAMDQNRTVMQWSIVVVVVQVSVLAIAALIYTRDQILDSSWIVDETVDEENQAEVPPTTPTTLTLPVRVDMASVPLVTTETRPDPSATVAEAILLSIDEPTVPKASDASTRRDNTDGSAQQQQEEHPAASITSGKDDDKPVEPTEAEREEGRSINPSS